MGEIFIIQQITKITKINDEPSVRSICEALPGPNADTHGFTPSFTAFAKQATDETKVLLPQTTR